MTKKLSPNQLIKSMNSTVNVSDRDEDKDYSFLDFIYVIEPYNANYLQR